MIDPGTTKRPFKAGMLLPVQDADICLCPCVLACYCTCILLYLSATVPVCLSYRLRSAVYCYRNRPLHWHAPACVAFSCGLIMTYHISRKPNARQCCTQRATVTQHGDRHNLRALRSPYDSTLFSEALMVPSSMSILSLVKKHQNLTSVG